MQLKDWMYDKSGSHPTRGEWIEIKSAKEMGESAEGLTPHGVSGLKYICATLLQISSMSHPTRGEWIEIAGIRYPPRASSRLTPHGVSGLKWHWWCVEWSAASLTPHGVSGLKLDSKAYIGDHYKVSPHTG